MAWSDIFFGGGGVATKHFHFKKQFFFPLSLQGSSCHSLVSLLFFFYKKGVTYSKLAGRILQVHTTSL